MIEQYNRAKKDFQKINKLNIINYKITLKIIFFKIKA